MFLIKWGKARCAGTGSSRGPRLGRPYHNLGIPLPLLILLLWPSYAKADSPQDVNDNDNKFSDKSYHDLILITTQWIKMNSIRTTLTHPHTISEWSRSYHKATWAWNLHCPNTSILPAFLHQGLEHYHLFLIKVLQCDHSRVYWAKWSHMWK